MAIGALVLGACGTGGDSAGGEAQPAEAATASPTTASAPAENEALQAFADAATVDGSAFDVAALAGRDTVAWFWAPWCVICGGEGPDVADVADRYGDQATILGVAGRGELDDMATFVDNTGTGGFPHLADLDGTIWARFGIYSQPAYAFIDDDGTVEVWIGSLGADALAERIDTLVAS